MKKIIILFLMSFFIASNVYADWQEGGWDWGEHRVGKRPAIFQDMDADPPEPPSGQTKFYSKSGLFYYYAGGGSPTQIGSGSGGGELIWEESASGLIEPLTASDSLSIGHNLSVGVNVQVGGDLFVNAEVVHEGDTDTYFRFLDDQIQIYGGTVLFLKMLESTSDEITINENSLDLDFRVESNNNTATLFVDGGTDRVGIKNSTPTYNFDVINSSSGVITRFRNSAEGAGILFDATGNRAEIRAESGDILSLGANDTDKAIIIDSGNDTQVFGDLSISQLITVSGVGIKPTGAVSNQALLYDATSGSFVPGDVAVTGEWNDSGTVLTTADANRDVQIDKHLTVNGVLWAATWGYPSLSLEQDINIGRNATITGNLEIEGFINQDTSHTVIALAHDLSIAAINQVTPNLLYKETLVNDMYIETVQLEGMLTPSGDLTVSVRNGNTEVAKAWYHETSVMGPSVTVNSLFSAGDILTVAQYDAAISSDLSNTSLLHIFYEQRTESIPQ